MAKRIWNSPHILTHPFYINKLIKNSLVLFKQTMFPTIIFSLYVILTGILQPRAPTCSDLNTIHDNLILTHDLSTLLSKCLEHNSIILHSGKDIIINDNISWTNSTHNLSLIAQRNIIFGANSSLVCAGCLTIKSGMGDVDRTCIMQWPSNVQGINMINNSPIIVYYNPELGTEKCKYYNWNLYWKYIKSDGIMRFYMLINDADDLANMVCTLSASYALSRDIDIAATSSLKTFSPIYVTEPVRKAFSGNFDGNGFTISNVIINSTERDVGLFGLIVGHGPDRLIEIKNLILKNITVQGGTRVGILAGTVIYTQIFNVSLENVTVIGDSIVGGICGTAEYSHITYHTNKNVVLNNKGEYTGQIYGAGRNSYFISHDASPKYGLVGYHVHDGESL